MTATNAEAPKRAVAGTTIGAETRGAWRVEHRAPWLVVDLLGEHEVLSWAVVGGGRRRATTVVWREVTNDDLRPPIDAAGWLDDRMREVSLAGAVGLLTSRRLDSYAEAACAWRGVAARAIATVGLGNALSVGDPPGLAGRIGTINVLCQVSVGLSEEAIVEAASIAVEARTAAVLHAGVESRRTGRPATGTGTDCVVVASPSHERRSARYAGKHTEIGHVVGASVYDAVARGALRWLEERARSTPERRHSRGVR